MRTTSTIVEEKVYYTSKIQNATPKPQRVKAYYQTSAPVTERIIEDVQIIQPSQQYTFAPRTYTLESGPEARYELARLEAAPIVDEMQVQPVVYETRSYRSPSETINMRIVENQGAYDFEPLTFEKPIYE